MGSDQADDGVIRRALAEAGYAADGAQLRAGFRCWRWVAVLSVGEPHRLLRR